MRENTTYADSDILVKGSSISIKHGTCFNVSIISSQLGEEVGAKILFGLEILSVRVAPPEAHPPSQRLDQLLLQLAVHHKTPEHLEEALVSKEFPFRTRLQLHSGKPPMLKEKLCPWLHGGICGAFPQSQPLSRGPCPTFVLLTFL